MKELKFRAWLKIGNPLSDDNWISINKLYFSGNSVVGIEDKEGELYGLKEIELMQFTGLKDKKGKEIYEGDILKFKEWSWSRRRGNTYKDFYVKVVWGYAGFTIEGTSYTLMMEEGEIVGNVYETPELLPTDAQDSAQNVEVAP